MSINHHEVDVDAPVRLSALVRPPEPAVDFAAGPAPVCADSPETVADTPTYGPTRGPCPGHPVEAGPRESKETTAEPGRTEAGRVAPGGLGPGGAGLGAGWVPPVAHEPTRPPVAHPVGWDSLVRPARPAGWRGLAHRVTGGLVAAEGRRERELRALLGRARRPVAGHHRIAVISIKGGVGKTTTTAVLGSKLADLRGDRVVAVDANPHRGTLADRVGRTCEATVRDVLRAPEEITRYPDIRALTSQAASRLEVLASETDPVVASAFDDRDYRAVAEVLERFYTVCLTDCGTGLTEPVVAGVLGLADALIVPAMASLDAANLAHATLDWLDAQGYGHLVRSAVVVICGVRGRDRTIDLDQLEDTLRHRVRDVVRIPYDPHLHSGTVTDLGELRPATDEAYLRLAATIADAFPDGTGEHSARMGPNS